MLKKLAIFGVLFLVSFQCVAEMKHVVGKIAKVQIMGRKYEPYSTEGTAITFIHMDVLPSSCGSEFKRVAITSDHPAYKEIISAALAAKLSNASVDMYYLDACTLWNNNAWDFAMFILQ